MFSAVSQKSGRNCFQWVLALHHRCRSSLRISAASRCLHHFESCCLYWVSGLLLRCRRLRADKNTVHKERWYVAAQPPAIFVLLFVFFNFINNSGTAAVWTPYLMDVFALTFAVLIILYLSTLFNWKTVGLFAVLLTTMDIILVIGSPQWLLRQLIVYRTWASGTGYPAEHSHSIWLKFQSTAYGIGYRGLGLGDFFFAGVLQFKHSKNLD